MGKAKYQDLSAKQKKIAKLANPKNEIKKYYSRYFHLKTKRTFCRI